MPYCDTHGFPSRKARSLSESVRPMQVIDNFLVRTITFGPYAGEQRCGVHEVVDASTALDTFTGRNGYAREHVPAAEDDARMVGEGTHATYRPRRALKTSRQVFKFPERSSVHATGSATMAGSG